MGKGARNRKRREQERERLAARSGSGGGLFGLQPQGGPFGAAPPWKPPRTPEEAIAQLRQFMESMPRLIVCGRLGLKPLTETQRRELLAGADLYDAVGTVARLQGRWDVAFTTTQRPDIIEAEFLAVGSGDACKRARKRVTQHHDLLVSPRRLLNAELPGGAQIEVGGQWVGPTQHQVLALIDELGLKTYPSHATGRHIAEVCGKRSDYTGRIPRLNPIALADIGQTQWRLDRLARRVARTEPWLAAQARSLDGQTFETWLRRTARTRQGRVVFRLITEAVFSAGPEDLSALWAGFYVGAAGGVDALINVIGGAQQDRIVGGAQGIALAMARELGDRVVLNRPVTEIGWGDAGVVVQAGGSTVRARRAVIAVPPPLTARIRFSPGLPGDRDQLVQRMPMGRVIKINVAYDEPFWRADGWSGQANSDARPLGTVFDNNPQTGGPGGLVGFLEGRHADAGARLDPAERRARVLEDLAGYFGARARNPIDYIERDWAEEEYSRGCYGAFTTPGTLTRFGPALRHPIGPPHWAGTETATRWAGYIDGAIQSGHRVADEVSADLHILRAHRGLPGALA